MTVMEPLVWVAHRSADLVLAYDGRCCRLRHVSNGDLHAEVDDKRGVEAEAAE